MSVGQANSDVEAQKLVVLANYQAWQASIVTLQSLKQTLKTAMINGGVQEGSQNDPRPLTDRTYGGQPDRIYGGNQ